MHPDLINKHEWILTSDKTFIDLDKWQKTINLVGHICAVPAAFIVQYTKNGFQVVIASQSGANPYAAGLVVPPEVNIFCSKVVASQTFLYEKNALENPEWQDNPEAMQDKFNTYLGYPVHWPDGDTFGTCCIMDYAVSDYEQKYIDLVGEFAAIIERDLELFVQHTKLAKLSITDDLTGLSNRRGFLKLAKEKIALAKRLNQSVSLLFCDVDKMKAINDSYGHKFGDQALAKIASFIKDTLREYDLAARIGGDEFAVLCLISDQEEVTSIVYRLSGAICIDEETNTTISMSIGEARLEADKEYNLEDLISHADINMYKHKYSKISKIDS